MISKQMKNLGLAVGACVGSGVVGWFVGINVLCVLCEIWFCNSGFFLVQIVTTDKKQTKTKKKKKNKECDITVVW